MVNFDIEDFDLKKIEESGQCFRMRQADEATWETVARDKYLRVKKTGGGKFTFSCDKKEFDNFWKYYFDLNRDYAAVRALVPADDLFLNSALGYGGGIRILKQDPFEMLITFIISQRKNIPAIAKAVETISERFGDEIHTDFGVRFAFPTAERLALCSQEELNACSLGYRSKYVLRAAQAVSSGELDLEKIGKLDDEELKAALKGIYGVGEKVANCVMLFGFARLSAFPRDVWINRVLHEVYNDDFDESIYAGVGGIIQQYMFFFARSEEFKTFCAV